MRTMANEYKFHSADWMSTKQILGSFAEKENKEKQDFCVAFLNSVCESLKEAEQRISELENKEESTRIEELKAEIAELKLQNMQLSRQNAISITVEDDKKITTWWYRHVEEAKHSGNWRDRVPSAHHMEYVVDVLPIGVVKQGRCSCGEHISLYDDGNMIIGRDKK